MCVGQVSGSTSTPPVYKSVRVELSGHSTWVNQGLCVAAAEPRWRRAKNLGANGQRRLRQHRLKRLRGLRFDGNRIHQRSGAEPSAGHICYGGEIPNQWTMEFHCQLIEIDSGPSIRSAIEMDRRIVFPMKQLEVGHSGLSLYRVNMFFKQIGSQ